MSGGSTAAAEAAGHGGAPGAGSIAALVAPDEAYDLLQALNSCRGSGLACVDTHLPGGLGPSELVVLRGEAGSAKSAMLRNIIVEYISPVAIGGHGLPAVLIDADGAFDAASLAVLLEARAGRWAPQALADTTGGVGGVAELVDEALSRLLVLRPSEPIDFLGQLLQLREVLAANPTASLLAVDSMSAWQALASAFPRSVAPLLRESWQVLQRLQRELCIAVVVVQRDAVVLDGSGAGGNPSGIPENVATGNCCHLHLARCLPGRMPALLQQPLGRPDLHGEIFSVCSRAAAPACPIPPAPFSLSCAGEVLSMTC